MRTWFFLGKTVGDRLHAFSYVLIVYQCDNQTLKVYQNLFVGGPDKKFEIDISKCSSNNNYMFGQDLTLLKNH